jgi:glycosyltransferase involved in cell wall biosynthesis
MRIANDRLKRLWYAAAQPAAMTRIVLEGARRTLQRARHITSHLGCLTFKPAGPVRGRVLLSYILNALFWEESLTPHISPVYYHANAARTRAMLGTYLELGYEVDLVSEHNTTFRPKESYDVLMATRFDMERLAALVPRSCVKIVHLETAETYFHGIAELARLRALQQRRGITLQPSRLEMPHRALESSDFATLTGNGFTQGTYQNARVPIYQTPAAPRVHFSAPANKDFQFCRKRFLWIGSEGFVHKGLDLALEAFADMPDFELVVCGPLFREPAFEAAYHRELYEAPNIHTLGWMDTGSEAFAELAGTCAGLVYPSCSEGQSGGVITCLHAGLIPIVSYESGVDTGDFGYPLKTSSIEEISETVRQVASLPTATLERQARAAWEFATTHHSMEAFSARYREVVLEILALRGRAPSAARIAAAREQTWDRQTNASGYGQSTAQ